MYCIVRTRATAREGDGHSPESQVERGQNPEIGDERFYITLKLDIWTSRGDAIPELSTEFLYRHVERIEIDDRREAGIGFDVDALLEVGLACQQPELIASTLWYFPKPSL